MEHTLVVLVELVVSALVMEHNHVVLVVNAMVKHTFVVLVGGMVSPLVKPLEPGLFGPRPNWAGPGPGLDRLWTTTYSAPPLVARSLCVCVCVCVSVHGRPPDVMRLHSRVRL